MTMVPCFLDESIEKSMGQIFMEVTTLNVNLNGITKKTSQYIN